MVTNRRLLADRAPIVGLRTLLLCALAAAGCASSGDVEQAREAQAQAKAKMSAELQQERTLAASFQQESETQLAKTDTLVTALEQNGSRATVASSTSNPTPSSPDAPTPSTVTFSPAAATLNNPLAAGETTSAATVTLTVSILDATGHTIAPSIDRPLTVTVHGAPAGVVTPAATTITAGNIVTFSYNGQYFLHSLMVTASMPDGAGGQAIGTAQLLQGNHVCNYAQAGLQSFAVNLTNPDYLSGLKVNAAVGYNNPAMSNLRNFTVDTGSLGVVVPASELGPNAVGPGPQSVKYYNSSGNLYSGNLYLAPVSFQTSAGTIISTTPIPVLAVTSTGCGPNPRSCNPNKPPPNNLRYLGVGFNRNSTSSNDLAVGPTFNAFLHLTDAANGSDIAPGYILSGQSQQVTLGITTAAVNGFRLAALTPNQAVPGDWNTGPGCFGFPSQQAQFCGNLLMDVGIGEMFLDLPTAQRPNGTVQTSGKASIVPPGTLMSILAGSATAPIMAYQFTHGSTSVPMAPTGNVTWINNPNIFVNTGRRVLAGFNYLFDAQCGQTGYQPI